MIVLIGGGSRSGKTAYALNRARSCGRKLTYIATAQLLDEEMRIRAAAHARERGDEFQTIEEPYRLPEAVEAAGSSDAVVVDCLTLWLTNLMLANSSELRNETERLLAAASAAPAVVALVTNEVGCGIVPENELARRFRDESGWMNQRAAAAAVEVHWMAFGYPMRVK